MSIKEKALAVKTHVIEHKEFYIGLGVGIVIASFTCVVMKGRHAGVRGVPDGPDMVTVRPFTIFSNHNNIITVVEREGRGHPGYIVKCLENGMIYLSQAEAAKELNIPATVLSGHLNGKFADVDGYHFERLFVKSNDE